MSEVVIIDVSGWQKATQVPYKELKEHGVVLVFIKASMGGGYDAECSAHVEAAREAGLLIGFYHWCDPTQSAERQALYFAEKIKQHNPDYICFDVEHWWDNWDAWRNGTAGHLSADQITTNFRVVYNKVYRETQFPWDRTFAYTAKWFVDIYGSPLIMALREFPGRLWWADYTQLWLNNWNVTWETWDWLWNTHFDGKEPKTSDKILGWDIWQVQSRIVVPPVHHLVLRLDTNTCSKAFANELRDLIGAEPEPEPEPEPLPEGAIKKVRIVAGALNIRKGPHSYNPTAGAALINGAEVYIYEVIGKWGRIRKNECTWIHLGYTQDV